MAKQATKSPAKNPLKITETSFRDGHQCTIATRMRTEDLEPIAEAMDNAGFYSIEMWGGATFDVMTRFLAEDPWERARILKRLMPKTPFQMLLRGQNLVGYRNYPNDVVKAFINHSAEVGIDIFRIFDALNDPWNLESSIKYVKESGKHAQAAISYSVTEGRLGGDIYNVDYYVEKALAFQGLGADSVCIKDMAGLINPMDVETLVKALKPKLHIPLQLHTHYTSGMASMAVLKGAEAGLDIVDACLAPMALRAAQPAIEPIVVTLQHTARDTGLDLPYLLKLGEHFEKVLPKYRDFLDNTKFAAIDTNVLMHQVPGGMISNLVSQLKEADAIDRIHEVYEELPRTRADMGQPPLVTPSSQIVGVQAVNNVLFGRYKMVTDQVKDYCFGLYGRPPKPISPELIDIALKGYPRGKKPLAGKTADFLQPEMAKAKEATKDIAKDIGDVLVYALYPTTGMRFLKWKYGKEPVPAEAKGKTLEDVRREDELIAKAKSGKLAEKDGAATERGPLTRTFNVYVGEQRFSVDVEPTDAGKWGVRNIALGRGEAPGRAATTPAAKPAAPKGNGTGPASAPAKVAVAAGESAISAPMPGLVIRYNIKEGAQVKAGDPLVVLEAMKMENALPAPVSGTVKKLAVAPGTKVAKGAVLVVIG
ncbi:MAG: pyruvate carboxylase subunit B [Chloroflexi bacterium]|nr:pyruvate carboxylase subunit B [Chloroflexota bacterium]